MQINPILAKSFRNKKLENIFRGRFCAIDENGKIIYSLGNINEYIFPHSAIKPIQAIALYKSGAKEKFSLTEQEIALCIASHHGEKEHINIVKNMLKKINCDIADLECGAHAPISKKARKELFASANRPNILHNSCSGKHIGMLAVAKTLNYPIKDYYLPDKEVQQYISKIIKEIFSIDIIEENYAMDGCSVPTYAAPLKNFAFGFAKLASGKKINSQTKSIFTEIFAIMNKYPYLIGGKGAIDSELMAAFNSRLMLKIGSDGIFCGLLYDKKIGFALKIDDGNLQAANVAIAKFLLNISSPNKKEKEILESFTNKIIKNWQQREVGKIIADFD